MIRVNNTYIVTCKRKAFAEIWLMKKFILLLIPIALSITSFAQIDSLSKFAYLIYSPFEDSLVKGTCFFTKVKNKTYLITANHVLTGNDPMTFKKFHRQLKPWVRIKSSYSKQDTFLGVELCKDTSLFHYYDKPDLAIIEFKNAEKFDINYINGFFEYQNSQHIRQPSSIVAVGYGGCKEFKNPDSLFLIEPEFLIGVINTDINRKDIFQHPTGYDRINYLADSVLITTNSMHGFSGCPAFLFYDNKPPIFGGVVIGQAGYSAIIVRPEFIYKELIRVSGRKRIK
jgi:hypothetical protein